MHHHIHVCGASVNTIVFDSPTRSCYLYQMLRKTKPDADRATNCQWVRCRKPAAVVYLGDGLCDEHWAKLVAQKDATP